ncbi:hypothetical protein DERF_006392 [Dermatophagoides farinae]|uniref:Uncharacterized protein n=1 Tax=Dermatophagoides farinae TaxID=6954 RepID=A0A922L7N3_DERFA|nr:hypothetical protein DERF_006392 [Dermatophagoides farinae]
MAILMALIFENAPFISSSPLPPSLAPSIMRGVYVTPIFHHHQNDQSMINQLLMNDDDDGGDNRIIGWTNYPSSATNTNTFHNDDDGDGDDDDDDLDVDFDGLNNYKEQPLKTSTTTTTNQQQLSPQAVQKRSIQMEKKNNKESLYDWLIKNNNNQNIKNGRMKRSGIADQRLAELLELARLDMIRKLVRDSTTHHSSTSIDEDVAYGLIDPHVIGRRRRRRHYAESVDEQKHRSTTLQNEQLQRKINDNRPVRLLLLSREQQQKNLINHDHHQQRIK